MDNNTIINTLRAIDTYEGLKTAIETLESVVWNFDNPECSCDYLRDAAQAETSAFSDASTGMVVALKLMLE
jgi:hypothetical protein